MARRVGVLLAHAVVPLALVACIVGAGSLVGLLVGAGVARPWAQAVAFAGLTVAAPAAFMAVSRRFDPEGLALLAPPAASGLLGGALLGVGWAACVVGVVALAGSAAISGAHLAPGMITALAMATGPAISEELLFRASLFGWIERSLGSWAALALSAAAFGAAHLSNPGSTLVTATMIAAAAGLAMGAAFLATRTLWLSMGLHAGWNFGESGVFGLPNSGFAQEGLLTTALGGPVLLTDGAFGIEASLVTVGLGLALAAALLAVASRRGLLRGGRRASGGGAAHRL